ncbi:MAG: hypothetical protein QMC81_11320 [Thermoanaerobacterales bacterium]|nr:hypothetical protein [Bacillota bacterium]MDI6908059.1 hypothetical protein [Thermoanaerobacterales bacterium]
MPMNLGHGPPAGGVAGAVNVYFHRPVLESFLFSLALAVGGDQ